MPRAGSALFVLLSLMVVCLTIAGLAINICFLELGRTELQISNDICARAACSTLARTGSKQEATNAAVTLASQNPVCGSELLIDEEDLKYGVATRLEKNEGYRFSELDVENPNAVWLQLDDLRGHGIDLPFGSLGEANQYRPWKEAMVAQVELDLAIVLDCSSSMAWPMDTESLPERHRNRPTKLLPGARWVIVQKAISDLLDSFESSAQRESVALCTFASHAETVSPLRTDYRSIRSKLGYRQRKYRGGKSNIADGILEGMKALSGKEARPWASRAILLISDGLRNSHKNPISVASQAADEFIVIHTLTVASEGNSNEMEEISHMTDGDVLFQGGAELKESFYDILKRLPIVTIR